MLKKIIILFLLFFTGLSLSFAGSCEYDPGAGGSISASINDCLSGTDVLVQGSDLSVEAGFKDVIMSWIKTIGGILATLAIGAMAYGAAVLVVSSGDDEKLKKGKDMIKWAALGFLGVVGASSLIALIVRFMYSLQ